MYKISEFAKMTGLPQSKVRFYEKKGLLHVHKDENGYRYFTPKDAFRVNAFRVLLQYGFTIEKAIQMLDEKQTGETFIKTLEEHKKEILNQIELMDSRVSRLDQVISLLEHGYENHIEIKEVENFLYVFASKGLDFSISNENAETFARFTDLMPISSNARIIKTDQLLKGEKIINPSYICGLPVSKESLLGNYDKTKVKQMHMGKCIRFYRQKTREESSKFESFIDLVEFVNKHQLKIRGEEILLLPTFLNLDGNGRDIEVLYVPIY